MDLVTVEARRPLVINHYMLYPGERRQIVRAQAEQIRAAQPGFIRIVGEPEPEPVEPEAPATKPAPEPEPPVEVESPAKSKRTRKEQNAAARRDLDEAA